MAFGKIVEFKVSRIIPREINDRALMLLVDGKRQTCLVEHDDEITVGSTVEIDMGSYNNVVSVTPPTK